MEEIWKPIPNFKNYEASNLGRIKRSKIKVVFKRLEKECSYESPELILKEIKKRDSGNGLQVRIKSEDGINKHRKIHRLVGLTFLGNPDVRHINGNINDNSVDNLEIKPKRFGLK